MAQVTEWTFDGERDQVFAQAWAPASDTPRFIAVIVHGYGEHIGRYGHVAQALIDNGGVVYGIDHLGHGKSGGERVLIDDYAPVVIDVRTVLLKAKDDWPGVPVILIGHSMGGMIGARYAQVFGDDLAGVVLSGAAIGDLALLSQLLDMDEIPDVPLDPAILSRDEAVGAAYAADELVWHGPFKRPTVQGMFDTNEAIKADGNLGSLPLLWVHGEADELVPIDGTRVGIEALKGTTFKEITYPGARHEIFNETNQDEVLADVNQFINDTLG